RLFPHVVHEERIGDIEQPDRHRRADTADADEADVHGVAAALPAALRLYKSITSQDPVIGAGSFVVGISTRYGLRAAMALRTSPPTSSTRSTRAPSAPSERASATKSMRRVSKRVPYSDPKPR